MSLYLQPIRAEIFGYDRLEGFKGPRGVAVDVDDNILAVDIVNHCIHKFTSDGTLTTSVGREGKNPLEFNQPWGIAVNPLNKKVYIVDRENHRVQILNSDLTFHSSFGRHGKSNGEFNFPLDVACDSAGCVYVVDSWNHCIKVFTAEGDFLRKFGKYGSSDGELNWPASVSAC